MEIGIIFCHLQSNLYQQMEQSKTCLVMLFVWLLYSGNTLNWQGTGNMSQQNMTVIWNYINTNFNTSKNSSDLIGAEKTYLSSFATNFSNQLNDRWDEAWNVAIIYANDKSDSVVYGYAFRDHWMWYNGKKMIDEKTVGFIIWKDYNCKTWITVDANSDYNSNFGSKEINFYNMMTSKISLVDISDPWSIAKLYAQLMEKDADFLNSAFSVIVSQYQYSSYFGRFCAVGYYTNYPVTDSFKGSAFFLQMR